MEGVEQIIEKLDEVKDAIEDIERPDVSHLGLLINESLEKNFSSVHQQLTAMNQSLVNITHQLRDIANALRTVASK